MEYFFKHVISTLPVSATSLLHSLHDNFDVASLGYYVTFSRLVLLDLATMHWFHLKHLYKIATFVYFS